MRILLLTVDQISRSNLGSDLEKYLEDIDYVVEIQYEFSFNRGEEYYVTSVRSSW